MKQKTNIKLNIMLAIIQLLTLFFLLFTTICSAQINTDEETFVSVFMDPTFEDSGFQFGADILKELEWGYIYAQASTYPELKDGYIDLVFSPGLAFSFFQKQNLQIYGGPRVGVNYRGGNPYAMIGMGIRFQVKLNEWIYTGLQLWVDHREDQKDEFYGDASGHKEGLVFTGPLSQENGAGFLTFKLN